ncbi:hypothetical protein AAY473_022323 [Plecturocebus cupreus]
MGPRWMLIEAGRMEEGVADSRNPIILLPGETSSSDNTASTEIHVDVLNSPPGLHKCGCGFRVFGQSEYVTLLVILIDPRETHHVSLMVLRKFNKQHFDHLRSGVQDQPGHHGKTPSLLKKQKLARHGGGPLQSQLLRRLRQENCLNPGSTEVALGQGEESKETYKRKQRERKKKEKKRKARTVAHACNPSTRQLRRLRQDNCLNGGDLGGGGCSEPILCYCTPAWATEQDSVSKKKKRRRRKEGNK